MDQLVEVKHRQNDKASARDFEVPGPKREQPDSRYETLERKAGLRYSDAWGWLSMSERTLISAVVSSCLRACSLVQVQRS